MSVNVEPELLKSPLFHSISSEVVGQILGSSNRRAFKKGDILIKKGEIPPALFVITKGHVDIMNEDVLLARLVPMSMLWESFLAEASGSATIIANDGLEVVE
ncbi:MAG: cyclic nucleotide-binding domain-containing protein, partial [Bacteroidota bacterium]